MTNISGRDVVGQGGHPIEEHIFWREGCFTQWEAPLQQREGVPERWEGGLLCRDDIFLCREATKLCRDANFSAGKRFL